MSRWWTRTLAGIWIVSQGISAADVPPNPIISRGKAVRASADAANADALVDGLYGGLSWKPVELPCRAAIRIGVGFQRLLLSWTSPGNASYTGLDGVPVDYSVDVSADSVDGSDGTWTSIVTVVGNAVRTRAHRIEVAGSSWVRLSITRAPRGVSLDEIDVHDVSSGGGDAWFFMGDSLTAVAYDRAGAHQPSFAALLGDARPPNFPAMIDGGVTGDLSSDGVSRIDGWLALNPDFVYWAIGYGTNDCARRIDPDVFQANLQTLVARIRSAGRIPLIARIPYSSAAGMNDLPLYNRKIDDLVAQLALTPGPDFHSWFSRNPGQLGPDGIHPTNTGAVSMNRLWAQAAEPLYTPPPPPPAPPPPSAPPPAPPPQEIEQAKSGTRKEKCGLLGIELLLLSGVPVTRRWRRPRPAGRRRPPCGTRR